MVRIYSKLAQVQIFVIGCDQFFNRQLDFLNDKKFQDQVRASSAQNTNKVVEQARSNALQAAVLNKKVVKDTKAELQVKKQMALKALNDELSK